MNKVKQFIYENWDGTLRSEPKDRESLIGLPYPYTVPSIKDYFNELYYWDTYFTNVGLILSNKLEYAKNNTSNIAHLINRYGYMPNGNRLQFLNRSQPPFFTKMVRDVYNETRDTVWLAEMYKIGKREYDFWQSKRSTSSGLNRYYYNDDMPLDVEKSANYYCKRLNVDTPTDAADKMRYAITNRTVCESGWDCNSRFGEAGNFNYNWIDLNCLLFGMENDLADFADILQNGEKELWLKHAEERRKKLNALCWNKKIGTFCDYNFEERTVCDFVSSASFYALFVGLCTSEQAAQTIKLLERLEQPHGLACCEPRKDLLDLQWDYPHGWACLHYIAIEGLLRYGYAEDAYRLAAKYCDSVELNFDETGNLWENYNMVTGKVSITKEGDSQITMLGWSAGVYLHCAELCGR